MDKVLELRDQFESLKARVLLGQYKDVWAEVEPLLERVDAAAHSPLQAKYKELAADLLEKFGDFAKSEGHLLAALQIRARLRDDNGVARIWRDLIFLKSRLRLDKDAAAILELAARRAHDQAEAGPEDLARLLSVLGSVAQLRGEHKLALALGEESLEELGKVDQSESAEAARQKMNNANALTDLGASDRAIELYVAAIADLGRLQGSGHPDIAKARINLGVILRESGKHDEAKHEYELALATLENAGMREVTATLLNNMASLDRSTGDLERARQRYESALEIRLALTGSENAAVADLYHNLANLDRATKRWSEADAGYLKAIALREKLFGRKHITVARALGGRAKLLEKTGRRDEAVKLYRETVAIADESESKPKWRALVKLELAVVRERRLEERDARPYQQGQKGMARGWRK